MPFYNEVWESTEDDVVGCCGRLTSFLVFIPTLLWFMDANMLNGACDAYRAGGLSALLECVFKNCICTLLRCVMWMRLENKPVLPSHSGMLSSQCEPRAASDLSMLLPSREHWNGHVGATVSVLISLVMCGKPAFNIQSHW